MNGSQQREKKVAVLRPSFDNVWTASRFGYLWSGSGYVRPGAQVTNPRRIRDRKEELGDRTKFLDTASVSFQSTFAEVPCNRRRGSTKRCYMD
jgi:hypothetical protein